MVDSVIVVGGGITGTAAAFAFREADVAVTLFEAEAELGGRMATAERNACRYDYGANHMTTPPGGSFQRLRSAVGDELVEIDGPIREVDAEGVVTDPEMASMGRWTGRHGMAAIPRSMAETAGARIRLETEITSVARTADGWVVTDDEGRSHESDALVLALAGPATADLLETADWNDPLCDRLAAAANRVRYRSVPVVAAHYPFGLDVPYFGLADDGESVLARVYREECKPGHVPEGESLLVVHLDAERTGRHTDPGDAVAAVTDGVPELVGDDRLADPDWTAVHVWEAALPEHGISAATIERAYRHDLAPVGDWVVGVGRSYATMGLGFEAGDRLRDADDG